MKHRQVVAGLGLLLVGCAATAVAPVAHAPVAPLALYAQALEESVDRYEVEARSSGSSARFDDLLDASLRQRGLSMEGLRALAREHPRFFFTQQALYATRLERWGARVTP